MNEICTLPWFAKNGDVLRRNIEQRGLEDLHRRFDELMRKTKAHNPKLTPDK